MCPWNVFTLRSAGSYWICQNVLWSVTSYSDWVTKSAWKLWMWQLTWTIMAQTGWPGQWPKIRGEKEKTKENIIIITGDEKEKTGSRSFIYYITINIICLSVFRTTLPICMYYFFRPDVWQVYNIIHTYLYIYILYPYLCMTYIRNYKYIIYNIVNVHIKI